MAERRRSGPSRSNSQRSRISGPQSALTDFLASHNISANEIRLNADQRRAVALASQNANGDAEGEADAEDPPEMRPPPPKRNESKAQEKKRKLEEEKAIAKIKASKHFKRRMQDEGSENEDEAARAIYADSMAPLPGQMENCAICDKRFTVTAYSRAGPDGGLLCPACTKEVNKEDGGAKKKRKVTIRKNRRSIASRKLDGTYHSGAKNLATLCVETLAKNADLAEDLGDLPQVLIDKIAAIFSKRRLIRPNTLDLFLRPGADTITVFDAAYLSSDDFIKMFQMVPTVKHIRLRNAIQFKNNVMDFLIGCPTMLETLSIHGANLIDDDHWSTYLKNKGGSLRSLRVYHTDGDFGDTILEQISISCPDLEVLKVSHNQKVTDVGLKHIAKLSKLQRLALEIYGETTSEAYVEILNKIGGNLTKFSISNVPDIDDTVLDAIHNNCRQLQKLRISDCSNFTDQGFVHLFKEWNNLPLQHVDFPKVRHIDASAPKDNVESVGLCSPGFEELMSHSGSMLKFLNIASCRHISATTFETVFSKDKVYPEMKIMDVSFIWCINDFIVGSIFRSCPNMRNLKIYANFGVKDFIAPRNAELSGKRDMSDL